MKYLLIIFSFSFFGTINAQHSVSLNVRENAVDVFIDCPNTNCPQDYIRQELSWVNYVRDRKLAQLHLLISSQSTAGNGREYLLDFIGLEDFEGIQFQLNFVSNSTQTEDEIRKGIIATVKLGLMPYIAKTNLAKDFEIDYKFTEELKEEKVEDKWKSWVFDVSSSGYFNGQETNQSLSLYNNASAKKITEKWKYVFGFFQSFNENKFKFGDETIVSIRKSTYGDGKIVKSLSPKLSYGVFADVSSSTFNNIDFASSLYTGIEYNIFPYSESSKRMLRMNYGIGGKYNNYAETTIFAQEEEFLYHQRLTIILNLIQNWGSINTTVRTSNYLHDFNLNNISLNSNFRVRLVKGLSLNLNGGVSFIHDQITLPKGEITLEETLLQQRQLSTQFSYYGNIGLSYTFGSIYNNIVNPRFGFD